MKTLDDLLEEIEQVKLRNLALTIHYNHDPLAHPNIHQRNHRLNVISMEFRHDVPQDRIQRVYEYIKDTYWRVVYDTRLITYNRIHIYLVKPPT
jgi:hypothetical protein